MVAVVFVESGETRGKMKGERRVGFWTGMLSDVFSECSRHFVVQRFNFTTISYARRGVPNLILDEKTRPRA